MSDDPRIPRIFVSYSHDSKAHKQWVLELAQRLRGAGIEVVIDQWDLEFGDDIPKFMEYWVTNAERVLMVCSEPYVQKVDEGRGGAGYEAMVVTQELVRNLGTKKFIPIIRQANEPVVLPKCIGTRKGVNLSSYCPSPDEEFEELVAQLRRLPPSSKPSLGAAPALALPSRPSEAGPAPVAFSSDATEAYNQAISLARSGDLSTWRRLIGAQRIAASVNLIKWRESLTGGPVRIKGQLPVLLQGGLSGYQALFAVALAGIESMQPRFNQQSSLVYDLEEPKGWDRNGSTIIISVPDSAAWVFQSLVGSMSVHTAQLQLALDLANQRIKERYGNTSQLLYKTHHLTLWPETLEHDCIVAWNFLWALPQMYPWIGNAFGDELSFREALTGYYLTLSWLEFLDLLKDGKEKLLDQKNLRFDVPPMFFNTEELRRGYRKVLEDREPLLAYALKLGVSAESQIRYWKGWVDCMRGWMSEIFHFPFKFYGNVNEIDHFATDLYR